MPSRDRSRWRNVHFYNASNDLLGGFFQAGSVTDANLIWILRNVLLVQAENLTIKHRASDRIITPSNSAVVPGDYVISCDDRTTGVLKNSIQNGLLISATLHGCFDQYMFSINPDDGYKIVSFVPDSYRIDGKVLDPICRDPNDPDHVADELLRWHFRQSVLANMRGAGEPIFESDFPPGTDQIATLQDEPYGRERFEMEVELRLGPRAREEEVDILIGNRDRNNY
ncbi:uncharacterized protein N7518_010041 [Penicillium psychrosexuale]|uniref:uncharacterized protein n=1 Tax=Penicillium psychrosexuale TaxID=1002107 RepID=UPI002544E31C|nr:uncharacterized protein N7518_010041 [Penicillium psychrosexuale]KAJ5781558.1 hypothetical protein N7518_010041 [Penicillium psychrosexuale]